MNSRVVGLLSLLLLGRAGVVEAGTVTATSCATAAVQAAITAAVDGDTVMIPGGTCTWTSGITTTKQIWIRAQTYTPTPGGTMTRSVTIINNSSGPLLSVTSGDTFHVTISGIRFNEGTGNVNHVRLNGTGSKVPRVSDCAFEIKQRFGNQPDIAAFAWLSQGGVVWNTRFEGVGGGTGGQCCPEGASILINSPRAWATASTMGTLDTNGLVNAYIEDSTLKDFGQSPDVDDRGRVVIRHSLLDGTSGLTHGFTSSFGGRHFEYYNNTFTVLTTNRNIAGRYFWIRAGTGIFTDNVVNTTVCPGCYGTPQEFSIGDNTTPGTYPQARQPGWGHNGTTNVSDPIYAWNETGPRAYSFGFENGWDSIVLVGRDVFVNSGAKPGYTKYPYPHPLAVVGTVTGAVPAVPTAVRVVP